MYILQFFHTQNLHIARDRTRDQTVASRGKGPDFWQPYVEEWEHPPQSASPGPRLQETEIHFKVAGWLVWAIHNKMR